MPRVIIRKKNKAGKERICGKCSEAIKPGDTYKTWSFRYGGTYYRCSGLACRPRPSDLTQSKLSEVYAAVESAEDEIPGLNYIEEIKSSVDQVAETTQEIAQEYEEAAEPFGGEGENAERAQELESWADELHGFDVDEEGSIEDAKTEALDLIAGCPL